MKRVLSLLIVPALVAGCSQDKSEATETMPVKAGHAYGSPPAGGGLNPNVPEAAKNAMPGGK